jgi:hypothetical protein
VKDPIYLKNFFLSKFGYGNYGVIFVRGKKGKKNIPVTSETFSVGLRMHRTFAENA